MAPTAKFYKKKSPPKFFDGENFNTLVTSLTKPSNLKAGSAIVVGRNFYDIERKFYAAFEIVNVHSK